MKLIAMLATATNPRGIAALVTEQKQPGFYSIGVPVHLGLVSGTQLVQLADLAEELGGDARITRQQNLILTSVP